MDAPLVLFNCNFSSHLIAMAVGVVGGLIGASLYENYRALNEAVAEYPEVIDISQYFIDDPEMS